MKYYLMNKNVEVLICEYNKNMSLFTEIYEIKNIKYAPITISNAFNNSIDLEKALNNWFYNRSIPLWRKDVKHLMLILKKETPRDLLNINYSLSLSDQYWLKEESDNVNWDDINYFSNDFKYLGYLQASLHTDITESISLISPNNTLGGMLQKGWIIENNNRVLVKGFYYFNREEPINEWLASNLCKRLNFDFCNYTLDIFNNILVSKCNNLISSDEEILNAYDIFYLRNNLEDINDFEHYINILEEHGLKEARISLENMFIIDYLIGNIDRHMKNFGVIRNINTLKWERVIPIYDCGESMQCNKLIKDINFNKIYGKFFRNTHMDLDDILKYIKNIKRIDIDNLKGIVQEYRNILLKYQEYTDVSNERINKLCEGLNIRIEKLNNVIMDNKKVLL